MTKTLILPEFLVAIAYITKVKVVPPVLVHQFFNINGIDAAESLIITEHLAANVPSTATCTLFAALTSGKDTVYSFICKISLFYFIKNTILPTVHGADPLITN